jgi:hypothetical protein
MDDFAALAARLAGLVDDVRGCLIVSRDALVLGAYPESNEARIKPTWSRFLSLGDAARGFVELEDEIWSFVRRGDYAAFVVTGGGVRPGLVLEQIDRVLATAHEAAQEAVDPRRLRLPEAAPAPRQDRADPLAPEPRPADLSHVGAVVEEPPAVAAAAPAEPSVEPAATAAPELPEGDDPPEQPSRRTGADPEADQAALAREFAGLLQDHDGAADW